MTTAYNERWLYTHKQMGRLAGYLAGVAVLCWPISYFASAEAIWIGHGTWWPVLSGITMLAAVGTTVGSAVAAGIYYVDREPLPGSNY